MNRESQTSTSTLNIQPDVWLFQDSSTRDKEVASLKRKAAPSTLAAKKRKPAKVPKGASELFNKWQAVRKDLVTPAAAQKEPVAERLPLSNNSLWTILCHSAKLVQSGPLHSPGFAV